MGCNEHPHKTELCSLHDIDVNGDAQCITMSNFKKKKKGLYCLTQ